MIEVIEAKRWNRVVDGGRLQRVRITLEIDSYDAGCEVLDILPTMSKEWVDLNGLLCELPEIPEDTQTQ